MTITSEIRMVEGSPSSPLALPKAVLPHAALF